MPSSSTSSYATDVAPRKKVVIVGAGPAGLLLAHALYRSGSEVDEQIKTTTRFVQRYHVVLLEKRPDPRATTFEASRTFPMALQPSRALNAMTIIPGLRSKLERNSLWSVGSCMHLGRYKKYIDNQYPNLCTDRNALTKIMLEHLMQEGEHRDYLEVRFDCTVENVNWRAKTVTVVEDRNSDVKESSGSMITYDYLVLADGAASRLRNQLVDAGLLQCTQKYIPDEYKTFFAPRCSPATKVAKGKETPLVELASDRVHAFLLSQQIKVMQVPLHHGNCHGVIIFPRGRNPFVDMTSYFQVHELFRKIAPHSLAHLLTDDEAQALLERPVASNLTVRCDRLHVGDSILLLGDAAHGVSASLGQGCNAALQDVQMFMGFLKQYGDWSAAMSAFTLERLPQVHALQEISSYSSPRTMLMNIEFVLRLLLSRMLPRGLSRYILRPMPMELLLNSNLNYDQIYEQTKWWTDRVKRSVPVDAQ